MFVEKSALSKIQAVLALPICLTLYEPFSEASVWSLTRRFAPNVQVVTSSIYKKLTGGIVSVSLTLVLPSSKVAPRSAVVAAKACGLTTKPVTKLSTYLLLVACVFFIFDLSSSQHTSFITSSIASSKSSSSQTPSLSLSLTHPQFVFNVKFAVAVSLQPLASATITV